MKKMKMKTGTSLRATSHQSPTLVPISMPIHTHGFLVDMGAMLLFMGGHRFCASLQPAPNRSQTSGCKEYANQEALQAEANDSERPFICPIQPRLGVGG